MSYQVLARKWRPRNFKEMAGQSHVLKTLINALDSNRLHHAYLFTGTRGVGKTTIARILARCLNCDKGITSEPCGECGSCTEINEGRFLDLIEVDAASRTKVEDTRELLDNVQYAPSRGRFKVYLIDEVHMLSTHSFNALLKTLEEPPPHVKFLLATTDPQKLPVTVLSRCLQFNLKNISPEKLVEHTSYILEQEKIDFEEGALWLLGRAAQGSVRDCLTLLDQAIGFCDGKVTTASVSELLGNIDRSVIVQLTDALIAQDAAQVLKLVAEAAEHSPDFVLILQELLSWLHRMAIVQVVPDGIDNSQGDRQQIQKHAASLNAETLQLYYQIALKGREDMPYALDPRSGLEMTLLRMLAFTPAGIPKMPTKRLSASQLGGNSSVSTDQKKKPVVERAVSAEPAAITPAELTYSIPATLTGAVHKSTNSAISLVDLPKPDDNTQSLTSTLLIDSGSPSPIALADLKPAMWITLFNQLSLTGVARTIAGNCVLHDVSGMQLVLLLQDKQAAIFNDEHRKRIEAVMRTYFGIAVELQIKIGTLNSESPAGFRLRKESERMQRAVKLFSEDVFVQELVQRFDGEIQYDSITPLTVQDWV
ncbi:MAG: DNA polymerase III subunit gamma/tau [Pseudohongiellaceae bacterium]